MKSNQSKRGQDERGISLKISHADYARLKELARKDRRKLGAQVGYLIDFYQAADRSVDAH